MVFTDARVIDGTVFTDHRVIDPTGRAARWSARLDSPAGEAAPRI